MPNNVKNTAAKMTSQSAKNRSGNGNFNVQSSARRKPAMSQSSPSTAGKSSVLKGGKYGK